MLMSKKIAISGDHAGFAHKTGIFEMLKKQGFEIMDMGPYNDESVDYPDFVHPVATKVEKGEADIGILICGSGNGVAMSANKHQGVRAAVCWNTELGTLARQHNDANILCLPARFISYPEAANIVNAFIEADFEGGRHQRRVDKIKC